MVRSEMVAEPCAKEKTGKEFPPSMMTPLPRMVREEADDAKLYPIAGSRLLPMGIVCPAMGEQSMVSPSTATKIALPKVPGLISLLVLVTWITSENKGFSKAKKNWLQMKNRGSVFEDTNMITPFLRQYNFRSVKKTFDFTKVKLVKTVMKPGNLPAFFEQRYSEITKAL